ILRGSSDIVKPLSIRGPIEEGHVGKTVGGNVAARTILENLVSTTQQFNFLLLILYNQRLAAGVAASHSRSVEIEGEKARAPELSGLGARVPRLTVSRADNLEAVASAFSSLKVFGNETGGNKFGGVP